MKNHARGLTSGAVKADTDQECNCSRKIKGSVGRRIFLQSHMPSRSACLVTGFALVVSLSPTNGVPLPVAQAAADAGLGTVAREVPFIVSRAGFWMMAAAVTLGPTLIRLAYRTDRTSWRQMLLSIPINLRTYTAPALWSVLMLISLNMIYLHANSITLVSNYLDAFWIVFYSVMLTLSIKRFHKYVYARKDKLH